MQAALFPLSNFFFSAHVQHLFFLSGSPDQDISKLEQHPVIVRLKEAYLLGARNEDSETGIRCNMLNHACCGMCAGV